MKLASRAISLSVLWLAACSGELRAKPQFECKPGIDSAGVVCSDGIIGSCVGGFQQLSVCGDTSVCDASWQEAGAYKCGRNDALGESGTTLYAGGRPDPALEAVALRVIEDSNSDGVLSPGEQALVSVSIRNAWRNTAPAVSGTLSTKQPGVTIASGSKLDFGDITTGAIACGSSSLSYAGGCNQSYYFPTLTIASNVAVGTMVQIDLTVTDSDSNSFALSFPLIVGAIDQMFSVAALTVVQDSNSDGVVSPGETAMLKIPVTNSGSSDALGIEGVVTTSQAGVTITQGSKLYFGKIESGATACGSGEQSYAGDCSRDYYLLTMQVGASVPATSTIPLKLQLKDAAANSFSVSFELALGAIDQNFSVNTIAIVQDSNSDGAVSPGESALLRVPVTNSGTSAALGVIGMVTTNQPGVTVTKGAKLYFGAIESGATVCGSAEQSYVGDCNRDFYLLEIEVASYVPVATTVRFELALKDAAANTFPLNFGLTLGAIDQTFNVGTISIVEDTNEDGAVSAGETASLRIPVRNSGTSDALGVEGTVSTEQPGVTITQGYKVYFGEIKSGATACGTSEQSYAGGCNTTFYLLQIELSGDVASATTIPFNLNLKDSYNNTFENQFSVVTR